MMSLLAGDGPVAAENALRYLMDHALDGSLADGAGLSRFMAMSLVVVGVIMAVALTVDRRSLKPKGIFRNALEALVLLIRDGMVRPAMGKKDGDQYVPYFCTAFVFILVSNWMGLIPIPVIGATITSDIKTTMVLALSTLSLSIFCGIRHHGIGGVPGLFIPGGVPPALLVLLFPIEVVGFFVKHSVLALRLFAVMIGGHLVIGAFLALPFTFENVGVGVGAVALALFVNLLEVLVGFLQAYVFTLLSVLFVGSMVHPDH